MDEWMLNGMRCIAMADIIITCCEGGFVGYTTRSARHDGVSTQTSEHQQVVHRVDIAMLL